MENEDEFVKKVGDAINKKAAGELQLVIDLLHVWGQKRLTTDELYAYCEQKPTGKELLDVFEASGEKSLTEFIVRHAKRQ